MKALNTDYAPLMMPRQRNDEPDLGSGHVGISDFGVEVPWALGLISDLSGADVTTALRLVSTATDSYMQVSSGTCHKTVDAAEFSTDLLTARLHAD